MSVAFTEVVGADLARLAGLGKTRGAVPLPPLTAPGPSQN